LKYSVAAATIGCKVNQYDTTAILQDFSKLGFDVLNLDNLYKDEIFEVEDVKKTADIFIVNTCTVTNISNKKSRQLINKIHKKYPKAIIIAYGCYAQVQPQELASILGVSLVIGTQDKHNVAQITADFMGIKLPTKTEPTKKPSQISNRTRTYLKVQDGCDNYCSYCIVPYARGKSTSVPIAAAITEAENLVESGYKEIVLTGVQLSSYGKDFESENLLNLITRLHNIPKLERLRLSSLEPTTITTEFLQEISKLPKFCQHFHLSLQSGSNRILKQMNRHYTTENFAEIVANIRRYFPKVAITTDIIVGFPGETDLDFNETFTFVENIQFFDVHVFAYSPKSGTAAANFAEQIPTKIKQQRSKTLHNLAAKLNENFYQNYIGETLLVLFESHQGNTWKGYTSQYLTVSAESQTNLNNQIVPVKVTKYSNNTLFGNIMEDLP